MGGWLFGCVGRGLFGWVVVWVGEWVVVKVWLVRWVGGWFFGWVSGWFFRCVWVGEWVGGWAWVIRHLVQAHIAQVTSCSVVFDLGRNLSIRTALPTRRILQWCCSISTRGSENLGWVSWSLGRQIEQHFSPAERPENPENAGKFIVVSK